MNTKVRMVEAVESTASVQEQKWLKKRTIFRRKLTEASLWVVGATAGTFVLMFTAGALAGYADPTGWAAFRVGLLLGGISAMLVFVVSAMFAFIWVSEQRDL